MLELLSPVHKWRSIIKFMRKKKLQYNQFAESITFIHRYKNQISQCPFFFASKLSQQLRRQNKLLKSYLFIRKYVTFYVNEKNKLIVIL